MIYWAATQSDLSYNTIYWLQYFWYFMDWVVYTQAP